MDYYLYYETQSGGSRGGGIPRVSSDRLINADTVSVALSEDCLDIYCLIYIEVHEQWEKKLYAPVLV